MKVVFYAAPGKFREEKLCAAVSAGCARDGDDFEVVANSAEDPMSAEVGIMVGMKSAALRERCIAAGQRVITMDKGYDRKDDWWRVSIDHHQPTAYLSRLVRPADRMTAAGWQLKPWRKRGSFVLVAGGGAKYHSVWGMEGPAEWAARVVREIRAAGWTHEIQYRPKPSQPDKSVPAGAVLSAPKYMVHALEHCHTMVTFGSNACFEAMLCGVPSVILGDAVMRDVSSVTVAEVADPYRAPDADRLRVLSSLAYCQWREGEFSSGRAWPEIKRQLAEVAQ